jgi:hypothetical protein
VCCTMVRGGNGRGLYARRRAGDAVATTLLGRVSESASTPPSPSTLWCSVAGCFGCGTAARKRHWTRAGSTVGSDEIGSSRAYYHWRTWWCACHAAGVASSERQPAPARSVVWHGRRPSKQSWKKALDAHRLGRQTVKRAGAVERTVNGACGGACGTKHKSRRACCQWCTCHAAGVTPSESEPARSRRTDAPLPSKRMARGRT